MSNALWRNVTEAQARALRLLRDGGPLRFPNSYAIQKRTVRMLAIYGYVTVDGNLDFLATVTITPAGREAIA